MLDHLSGDLLTGMPAPGSPELAPSLEAFADRKTVREFNGTGLEGTNLPISTDNAMSVSGNSDLNRFNISIIDSDVQTCSLYGQRQGGQENHQSVSGFMLAVGEGHQKIQPETRRTDGNHSLYSIQTQYSGDITCTNINDSLGNVPGDQVSNGKKNENRLSNESVNQAESSLKLPARLKKKWTKEEDERLLTLVAVHGIKWVTIAEHMSGRTNKTCRERWLNHLDPTIKKGKWTPEEDQIILGLHQIFDNQ